MPDFKRIVLSLFSKNGSGKKAKLSFAANDVDKNYVILSHVLIGVSSCMLAYMIFLMTQRSSSSQITMLYSMTTTGPLSLIYMTLAIACITGIAILRTRLPFSAPAIVPIILFALSCVEYLRMGFADGFSGLWIFVVPSLIYFTAGKKIGFIVSFAIFLSSLIFLLFPRLSIYYYSRDKFPRIITIYLLLFVTTHIYEHIRISKEKNLEKLNRLLKAERDEFTAMRNSLKTGLCLMDENLIIQKNYAPLLEEIFGTADLGGIKFTDLLASSLTSAEISTTTDFFEMVSKRRFDTDMLDDINPLQELKYIRNGGEPVKILHCMFTPIKHTSGETMIMCNIEDITAKIELKKQFEHEEAKHQAEISTLFEVLQIGPGVFNDFIEDTEYEFETINDILKNSRVSSKDTLVTIFQSIHAIKANAIILGLNNYSQKLHDIESYIKDMQAKAEVGFDDMLSLTVRIESVMEDKDNFRKSVEKIKSFSRDGVKKSASDILIENLNRTADRTAGSTGKKIILDTDGINAVALEKAPRRLVKEILLQLVRNAVFHGIESPDERLKNGKKESGLITVSVSMENEKIHIRIRDDGKGLDFEKIKQRAEQMHLIRKNEKIEDKSRIYQAIFMPGFSTAESGGIYAGRGVGLDLVRSRIKEHNGTIKIQTEAGKGSVFHVFLPLQNTGEDIKE
jgi:two-component system chemotaxis sensor kinase CheA